jgi:peptide/nickel transport system substrate-binding protein
MTFPYAPSVPLLKDVKSRMPQAICELTPTAVNRNLIVNRDVPPFDNPDLRRAMSLTLDRQAFIDIISDGQGDIGGVMATTAGRALGNAARGFEQTAGI